MLIDQINEANKALSEWVQTLPVPLIIPGCNIHDQVQKAMLAAVAEINRLRDSEERAWRERNYAVTKVRAWEDVVFVDGLPMRPVAVEEFGPGEGDQVVVPVITPSKLTEMLEELAKLRARSPR